MAVLAIVKIGQDFRVTIPKEVRELLELEEGDELIFFKTEKMIIHARLALEQIVLRLETVSELGDVVSALAPTVGVLRSVRRGMAGVLPEAERKLGQIGNLLSEIITDSSQSTGLDVNFEAANEDAQKILKEAATVAEQKIKEELPEISGVPTVREKVPTQT